jgi:signal transduction histidine kinase
MPPSASSPTLPSRRHAWLFLLLGGVIAVFVIVVILLARALERELLASAGERLAVAASDVAEKLDRNLFERYGDIRAMARSAVLRGRDPAAMTVYLKDMQDLYSFYHWIAVADARGRIVAATDPGAIGRDASATAWFQAASEAARKGAEVHMEDARPSPETGGMASVSFTAPVIGSGGAFLGAVTSRVALAVLEDVVGQTVIALLAQHGTAGRVEYHLLRADGELMADSFLREEGRVNLIQAGVRSARLAASGPPGFVEEVHSRRQMRVLTGYAKTKGFESFPGFGWLVLVRMDKDDLLAPITAMLWQLGWIGGLGVLPLLGLLVWTIGRLQHEWRVVVRERDRAVAAEEALEERERRLRESLEEEGRVTAALERANVFLRTATQDLEEMTSIIAHDLKAPLVTIQGYAGRLEALYGAKLGEKAQRYLTTILEVSRMLGQMVDGLLEVSHIHRRAIRPRPIEVRAIVERARDGLGEQFSAAGVTLQVELDQDALSVWADPVALYEIIENLLANALKFKAPGRPLAIAVGTERRDSQVVLWVRDNGIGIPADKLDTVFQIFRKLDKKAPGIGVGLAAVKKLIHLHGGTVWIESRQGLGAAVFAAFPQREEA